MWEFDESGELYYEKFISKFVDPLLDKWTLLGVSHSLTVIFYARSYRYNLRPDNGINSLIIPN